MAGKQASDSRDWLKCFASREARTPATSAGEDPFLLLPVNLQYSKNHIKKPSYREIPCADWVPVTLSDYNSFQGIFEATLYVTY